MTISDLQCTHLADSKMAPKLVPLHGCMKHKIILYQLDILQFCNLQPSDNGVNGSRAIIAKNVRTEIQHIPNVITSVTSILREFKSMWSTKRNMFLVLYMKQVLGADANTARWL